LRFIPFLDVNFVDPTGESGYPLAVVALLPFLLLHYDDPTPMCVRAAQLIAEVIMQIKSKSESNVAIEIYYDIM
jgi:hypothetical protein